MLDEPGEHLGPGNGDRLAVFGAEGDAARINGDEALIGDADAMGVSAEVAKDLLGPPNGRLA